MFTIPGIHAILSALARSEFEFESSISFPTTIAITLSTLLKSLSPFFLNYSIFTS